MAILMFVIFCIFLILAGAYAHELDIKRNLKKSGDAGYSSWTGGITSKEMKE